MQYLDNDILKNVLMSCLLTFSWTDAVICKININTKITLNYHIIRPSLIQMHRVLDEYPSFMPCTYNVGVHVCTIDETLRPTAKERGNDKNKL